MLSSVKTQPRMWLLSFDFVLNILQCPHRESYAEKLCEAQVVIFQPEDVLFLASAKNQSGPGDTSLTQVAPLQK